MSKDVHTLTVKGNNHISGVASQLCQAIKDAVTSTASERPVHITINLQVNYASGGGAKVTVR